MAIVDEIKRDAKKKRPAHAGRHHVHREVREADRQDSSTDKGLHHNVLNARHHEQEAEIVAEAGVPGAMTIATNMAGRGTDIQLGGNAEMRVEQATAGRSGRGGKKPASRKTVRASKRQVAEGKARVKDAGGLYVLASERHESRRIDNQLRGRSGRPGRSGAIEILPVLGGRPDADLRIRTPGQGDGQDGHGKEGEAIDQPFMTKSLERAQAKVEGAQLRHPQATC